MVQTGHSPHLPCPVLQGFNVNLVTTDRVSALHEACLGGHVACAKVLLENGAQVSPTDTSGVAGAWGTMLLSSAGVLDRLPAWQGQDANGLEHLRWKWGKPKQCFVSVGDRFAFPSDCLGHPIILFCFPSVCGT